MIPRRAELDSLGPMEVPGLSAEDQELVTRAREARDLTAVNQGAAVRDLDGRVHAASTVEVGPLSIGALDLAIAMVVSAGGKGLLAAALVTDGDVPIDTETILAFAGADVPVIVADHDGEVDTVLTSSSHRENR